MRKLLLTFVLVFFLIGFITAECVDDNDFTIGDEVNICTDGCLYQNSSNQSQFLSCDSSVTCLFTAFYPNGNNIVSDGLMSINGSGTFNYSLGNSTIELSNTTGIFRGYVYCYKEKGWVFNEFLFSVSTETRPIVTSGSGFAYTRTDLTAGLSESLEREKEEILKKINKNLMTYAIIGSLLIIAFFGIQRDRKRRRNKQIAKEINKLNRKLQ